MKAVILLHKVDYRLFGILCSKYGFQIAMHEVKIDFRGKTTSMAASPH